MVTGVGGFRLISPHSTRADRKFPHVEGVKLWFLENPRFEERASGPSLCADLERSKRRDVAVTFDVWGNRVGTFSA